MERIMKGKGAKVTDLHAIEEGLRLEEEMRRNETGDELWYRNPAMAIANAYERLRVAKEEDRKAELMEKLKKDREENKKYSINMQSEYREYGVYAGFHSESRESSPPIDSDVEMGSSGGSSPVANNKGKKVSFFHRYQASSSKSGGRYK